MDTAAVSQPATSQAVAREPVAFDPAAGSTAVVRLFAGFAGFGAGSVNLAVSSSLFAGPDGSGDSAQVVFGVLAGLWGTALIGGTVLALSRGRIPAPGLSLVMLMVAAAVHAAATIWRGATGSSLSLSHLTALLLTLMMVGSLAWLRRRDRRLGRGKVNGVDDGGAPAAVRPGRLLLGAFAGAVLVAGIATPGLAASTAGQFAVPHGQHGQDSGPVSPFDHNQSGEHRH
ncbi:hypothetical protein [Arthrobacter sp. CDRTa11]|uniref:hypothetical protein n=1 Tax=Arthrobacter sp. CDRTa11 TaxID=2651199 RepID=UPI002265B3DB|nr:hypothetical protein [Arthrobacter sp. CDRTa11]